MKKTLALILALVMLFAVANVSFAESDETLVVTVMLPNFKYDTDFQAENNPILDYIEQETGVRLDIQWVPNSAYGDILSTTLADPANMPMVISLTGARDPLVISSARNGAFWDITDMIGDYENLSAGSEGIYNNIKIDGRLYGIYRGRAQVRGGIYYRSDIAAEMGITEKPETIEDLTDLAMALAEYAAEHDGYALNMVKYVAGTIGIITVAHGAPFNWGVDENGDIYPAHKDPHFLEGLNWLRELCATKGGINPNFMQIESGEWDKIERNGKAFMRFDCLDNCYRQQEWFEKNEGITDVIWTMVPTVKAEDGNNYMWPQNAGYAGEVVITSAVKDEETARKILAFLDWCNSPAGTTAVNCGVEGVTYWIREDGYRYSNPADDVDTTHEIDVLLGSLNQLGMNVAGDFSPVMKKSDLRLEYDAYQLTHLQYIVNDPCHALTSNTNTQSGSMLSQLLEDAHVQYIAGFIDEDGLRAAWEEWEELGGAAMTAEYNEAYQAIH